MENDVKQQIETLLMQIGERKDDIDFLSNCCMKLASLLYLHSTLMAEAELDEARTLIGLIDAAQGESKKMAVAEAERRAKVMTGNKYELLKSQSGAVIETINSIKKRLDVLSKEYRRG